MSCCDQNCLGVGTERDVPVQSVVDVLVESKFCTYSQLHIELLLFSLFLKKMISFAIQMMFSNNLLRYIPHYRKSQVVKELTSNYQEFWGLSLYRNNTQKDLKCTML